MGERGRWRRRLRPPGGPWVLRASPLSLPPLRAGGGAPKKTSKIPAPPAGRGGSAPPPQPDTATLPPGIGRRPPRLEPKRPPPLDEARSRTVPAAQMFCLTLPAPACPAVPLTLPGGIRTLPAPRRPRHRPAAPTPQRDREPHEYAVRLFLR